jgi:hypothetical protein
MFRARRAGRLVERPPIVGPRTKVAPPARAPCAARIGGVMRMRRA